ncbi:MAG: DUF4362 domain-containing protein [Lachnospiraceae bacterium]|nr:DUF4362 domain-containing protein [Lachnospiraceae bacterium]
MHRIRRLIENPKAIISVCILLIFLVGICFIGRNVSEEENIAEDKEQSEVIQATKSDGELTIKEKLAAFPNDSASLAEEDIIIVLHGKKLDEFWSSQNLIKMLRGYPSEVYFAHFTIEGDAIITYLQYDGTDYFVARDRSRDMYVDASKAYEEKRYPYLKDFGYTDSKGNSYRYLFLTDTNDITMGQLEEYWATGGVPEEIEIYEITHYMSQEMDENAPKAIPTTVFDKEVNTFEGVSMNITFYKPTSAHLEILNTTDYDVIYGDYYDLQMLQDGEWYSLSYVIDNWAFTAIGYYAYKNIPSKWGVDWTGFHGVLEPGQYRIVKHFHVSNDEDTYDHTEYYMAAEFTIER